MKVSRRKFLQALPTAGAAAGLVAGAESVAAAQAPFDGDAEALANGGELRIARGATILERPFRFAGQRLNLRGEGPYASLIRFDLEAPGSAIELNTPSPGGQYQSSVTGLGFLSRNSVPKTAIKLVNVGSVNIERIGIATAHWPGERSIGIRTAGREMIRIRDSDIACARPIVISPNVQHPSLAADYLQIESCILVSTLPTGSCIEVEDGSVLTNMAVRDTALVGGTNGFRFDDRSSVGASYHIEFQNIRTEQGTDPDGWSFDIRSSAHQVQNLLFQNIRCEQGRNGIRVRNGLQITLINVMIEQTQGRTGLDIEFIPGTVLTILGGWIQPGGAIRLINARKAIGVESATGSAIGPVEVWIYDRP
jgi:hypothetical protein